MGDIGYLAANLSERDLVSGYDALQERKKEASFPFVSANMVFQSSHKPIVEPYTIVKFESKKYSALKNPLRVAITGVTRFNPTFQKSAPPKDNVIIAAPIDELKKYLPEMRKKADQIVVLAAMPRDDAHLLARELPGIDLVVGAYLGTTSAVEEKEGSTPIFYVGNQGKWLAELRMMKNADLTELRSNLHYLGATYPDEPSMQAKVDAALSEINNRNRVAAQTATNAVGSAAAAGPAGAIGAFVTSASCKDCHTSEYARWEASKHAQAMRTLEEKQADFNPECVGCHVLGYKKQFGFVDMKTTAPFANVQCESCHGMGARHVRNPQVPYGKAGAVSCVPCHTRENSPNFEFGTYWAKIRHGE